MHREKLYRPIITIYNMIEKKIYLIMQKFQHFFRIYLQQSINIEENLLNNHIDDEKDCVISIIST